MTFSSGIRQLEGTTDEDAGEGTDPKSCSTRRGPQRAELRVLWDGSRKFTDKLIIMMQQRQRLRPLASTSLTAGLWPRNHGRDF